MTDVPTPEGLVNVNFVNVNKSDVPTPEDLANVNKPAVQRLVAALRSGNYQQGRRHLMQVDEATGRVTYCCLGVACILVRDRIPIEVSVNLAGSYVAGMFVRDDAGDTSASLLTPRIARFYGFTSDNPALLVPVPETDAGTYDYTNATIANDEFEMDFDAIADAFERTYLPADVTQ